MAQMREMLVIVHKRRKHRRTVAVHLVSILALNVVDHALVQPPVFLLLGQSHHAVEQ